MEFSVWVVLCSPLAVDRLVAYLVREGYAVGRLAGNSGIQEVGEVSCLAALKVTKTISDAIGHPQRMLLDLIKNGLATNNLMHHGIIVSHHVAATSWDGSNITLPLKTDIERILMPGDEIG